MSEIRRVKVVLKNLKDILSALDDLGVEYRKISNNHYELSNHGIRSHSSVNLKEVNGAYEIISRDARQSDIRVLSNKISSKYAEMTVKNVLMKRGWKKTSETQDGSVKNIKMHMYIGS